MIKKIRTKKVKVGIIIPASMQISGLTSGVNRFAISYKEIFKLKKIECKIINLQTGVQKYSHILIFQHTPEINLLIKRIRMKNKNAKIIFLPIYDPNKVASKLKKIFYKIPFEKFKLNFSPREMKLACDYADAVWVMSSWEKNAIKATGTKTIISISPVVIPFKINEKLEGIEKDINFLFVGHIDDPRKNIKNLIYALSIYGKSLHIVGNGSFNKISEIKNLSSKLGVMLKFHGKISDAKLSLIYARSKVLCLPSYVEGAGLVAMEALAYGSQVAVTSIGGPKDYFRNYAYFIDHPNDINDITRALKKAYENSNNFAKINHQFINKNSHESISEKIVKRLLSI